jgi:hypothetical protein
MDYFKTYFNETEWCVYLIEDDDFELLEESADASTDFHKKELYFRKSEINFSTVLHETWHVYFSYCYLDDTNDLTLGDIEEVSAALFADKAQHMIKRAEEIYTKLKELRAKNG